MAKKKTQKKASQSTYEVKYTNTEEYMTYVRDVVIPHVISVYGKRGVEIANRRSLYMAPGTVELVNDKVAQLPQVIRQNMHFVNQRGDGLCLFHALGFIVGKSAIDICAEIAEWYADPVNATKVAEFSDALSLTENKSIDQTYITSVRDCKIEGGEYEIYAFSCLYGLSVFIYNTKDQSVAFRGGDADESTIGTMGKNIILYYPGGHYDSLIPHNAEAYAKFIKYYQDRKKVSASTSSSSSQSKPVPSGQGFDNKKPPTRQELEAKNRIDAKFIDSIYRDNLNTLNQSKMTYKQPYNDLLRIRRDIDLKDLKDRYDKKNSDISKNIALFDETTLTLSFDAIPRQTVDTASSIDNDFIYLLYSTSLATLRNSNFSDKLIYRVFLDIKYKIDVDNLKAISNKTGGLVGKT